MKSKSCHLVDFQPVLYCIIAQVASHFSAFFLTIGFQGNSRYPAIVQITRHVFSHLSKSPPPSFFTLFMLEWVLNEETDNISQKSGPFQKPTWKFHSFLSILFILTVVEVVTIFMKNVC